METQALTVDVEDYFQVSAFADNISVDNWDAIEPRVEMNTDRLLELFDSHDAKATFFVLGWAAKRFPDLIKRIVSNGHELASHGMMHQRASDQTREEFKEDVGDTKRLLEDIAGTAIKGYRAPSFSFTKSNLWAYDVLKEEGYRYSSSVYPIVHDHYGIPDAPRERYTITPSGIDEIPLSTIQVMGKNIPISGGGYFRLYPYFISRLSIKRFAKKKDHAYIFYMHPWEIDPEQPVVEGISLKARFRHYLNLSRTQKRLSNMLSDFQWSSMEELYGYK